MATFLVRRLLASLLVLVGVVTLVFGALRAAPGDPVESILGEQALVADKASMRACFRLDEPVPVQYGLFWRDVLDGSFGELCDQPGVTVMDKLVANVPSTVELALAAMLVALMIALPLGIASALRPYSWIDNGSAVLALLGISIPNFWLGPMLLLLFSITLRVLPDPGSSVTGLSALLLPAITLGTALAAKLTRMTRSSMLEILRQDYVRTAHAKGLRAATVVIKHALRNALIPIITVLGLQFGSLLAGAIIVEKVFARPGVGTMLLAAIESRDYMQVQGAVLLIALSYIAVNLIVDLLYAWADPRIRLN